MKHFKYIDMRTNLDYNKCVVIFECYAEDIDIADKYFEVSEGYHPSKKMFIGCGAE